jgi:hypothetical protein
LIALGLLSIWQPSAAANSSGVAGLALVLKADKESYGQGEPIKLTIHVMNRRTEPVTLRFLSAQRYDVAVKSLEGREIWRWSNGRMFAQVIGDETFQAGTRVRIYHITMREHLPPGRYVVIGTIPAQEAVLSGSITISIH